MRLLLSLYLIFIVYRNQAQIPVSFTESEQRLLVVDSSQNNDPCRSLETDLNNLHKDSLEKSAFINWLENYEVSTSIFKPPEINWKIGMNAFYAHGQTMSYFGNGWFTDIGLENNVQLLGLPIRLSGHLIVQNNQVNTRLSSLAFELDHQKYTEQIKHQLQDEFYISALESLPSGQQNVLLEQYRFEKGQALLNHSAYRNCKAQARQALDSLSLPYNSVDSSIVDSAMARIAFYNEWEQTLDSISRKYHELQKEVGNAMLGIRQSSEKQQQLLEDKIQSGNLNRIRNAYPKASKARSIFANISRLSIGSFNVRGSSFDISSIPVHGIGFELRRNGYYAAVSYGREGRQRRTLPDYVRNLRLAGEGRKVAYVKAGIGMPEKSHLHLTLSQIKVPGTPSDTIYPSMPKRSVALTLDSRYELSDHFYLNLTGSLSGADFSGKANADELFSGMYKQTVNGSRNLACLAQVGWKDKAGNNDISIGYQIVGSEFTTLGNLFLLKNRNTIRVETRHRIWQNRLHAKITYVQGITNAGNTLYPGIRQNQFSGTLSYRLDKRGSRIWSTYSPSYYLQEAPGTSGSVLYALNLVTAGGQIQYPRSRKGQWVSIVQLTNYSDQAQYGDTSTVSGLWYGMVMQSWVSEKYSFTILSNLGFEQSNWSSVRDLNIDVNQSFTLKGFQISQGLQLIKRPFDNGLFAGITAGAQIITGQSIRLGVHCTYLYALSSSTQNQVFLNTTLGWQF